DVAFVILYDQRQQFRAPADNGLQVERRRVAVMREGGAEYDAPVACEVLSLHDGIEDRSVHGIEVHIDSLGCHLAQTLFDGLGAMIDARVEVRFLDAPAALFAIASDADHATSLDARNLARHRAHGSG